MKLPRTSNGKRYAKHPLIVLVEQHGSTDLGRKLGVHHSSINTYYAAAKADRDALVPATWALPLAKLLDDHPAIFRPDLYPRELFPLTP